MDDDAPARAKIMEHGRAVSIMEFSGGLVAYETQYFADPFDPAPWRAALAEQMPDDRSG
jgi:hypothetical protein